MELKLEHVATGQVRIGQTQLRNLAHRILAAAGVEEEDARIVADSLVEADARGMNSHGIIRLPVYVDRLLKGGVNARPNFLIVTESDSVTLCDAGDGLGAVATRKAMEIAIEKAKRTGIAATGVRNSNHNGEGARYVRQATSANMIGVATTNSSPIMPAWGGRDPLVGPLPIAFGIPTDGEPIILDMALGMSSRGKILYYLEKGLELPSGWLVDAEGRPTTDPSWINKGGWILPIGGHKGWGLILICEILSGILTGGAFGKELTNLYERLDHPQRNGHLLIAIDIAKFVELSTFKRRVGEYMSLIKMSRLAPGFDEILVPGEIESRNFERQQIEGITISRSVVEELLNLASRLNIAVEEAA
ncbi:Ldh family oxidoreductase [Aminobacter sp. MSH1]|uniref:Ldh family oxidoreductase n=1 Tax=Aminobacter sp. MSH1 TaxID=374606 RepID=UPI000D3C7DC8|nr:Ldh family oxidoreductase [Aminobacter sp. MSH1]